MGGVLRGGKRPDVLITESGRAPVVLETEFSPASTLERDALERLHAVTKDGRQVAAVVAVRLPARFKMAGGGKLRAELRAATDLEYAVYQPERFPKAGYITGGVTDVAQTVQAVSMPAHILNEYVDEMSGAIKRISDLLAGSGDDTKKKIAKLLSQKENEQTWSMAGLILSNAFVFHSHIAGERGIKTLQELTVCGTIPTVSLAAEWDRILEINYYAIFDVARNIIKYVNEAAAQDVIQVLVGTTGKLNARGLSTSTDLYGPLIQRMIEDRGTLASFYTLPESATLLAGLAVPPPGSDIYSSPESMKSFRFGDFACGTGTLLTTAYKILIANYETTGRDMREIHDTMMAKSIFGFDVLPSAVHLTVSALAECFPKKLFTETRVGKILYGRHGSGATRALHLGSLDLIAEQSTLDEKGNYVTGTTSKTFKNPTIGHGTCHMVLMNPPFTTNTKGGKDHHAMFASFETSRADQTEMAAAEKKLFKPTCADGNAGAASNFVAIADKKLKPGGVLGLVLPSTIAWGASWKKCRELLGNYEDLTVVSIASSNVKEMSFSFDTGMGEVLVVARKRKGRADAPPRGRFASIHRRPKSVLDSIELYKSMRCTEPNRLDGDNYGGTPLKVGQDVHGHVFDCPLDAEWWWPVSVRDPNLIQLAYGLYRGDLKNPGSWSRYKIPTAKAGSVFGLSNRDICSDGLDDMRAPFTVHPNDGTSIYPVLRNNDAGGQTCMVFRPDGMAVPKPKADRESVERVAKTATRLHVNHTCRYTSQRVLFPYTAKPTLASSVFPSFKIPQKHEKAMAVWGNSTLGIICFWAHAGKQQLGRGRASRMSMENMAVLNASKLKKNGPRQIRQDVRQVLPKGALAHEPMLQGQEPDSDGHGHALGPGHGRAHRRYQDQVLPRAAGAERPERSRTGRAVGAPGGSVTRPADYAEPVKARGCAIPSPTPPSGGFLESVASAWA